MPAHPPLFGRPYEARFRGLRPASTSRPLPDRPPESRAPTTSPLQPGRIFRDAEGVEWCVTEERFGEYDRRRGASLIFSSESVVRRVRDYPAEWRGLSEVALLALSWKV